jgi:2-polyprenyl-6-methoxyphenol hydroxylase-like FAD-dependent oxidoreductase
MEYPVVIIGTGPSGATTALLLARLGVKSLAISRHRNTANTPRAHIFNQRAMEVLRDAGLEERLKTVASNAQGKFLLSLDASSTAMELTLDEMQICSIRHG